MITALALLSILAAGAYLLGAAICRACNGYGAAQEEIERDREWWRGVAEMADALGEERE